MKDKKILTAAELAKKDMAKALKEDPDYKPQFFGDDRWTVTPTDVFTKKAKKLNQELDLHKVNKEGNKNGKRKIKTFEQFFISK